jgi:glucokinase
MWPASNNIRLFVTAVTRKLTCPMPERSGVIALDVGGTKTACGLFLCSGEPLWERTVTTVQDSADSSVRQLAALVEEAVTHASREISTAAVGIVVPGWVDRRSRTVWAPNIAGWNHIPLERRLSELVRIPVVLDSDRSGYVMGEAWLGAARGLQDVVFLAVGTGIGAGILSGGRLVHGHDDLAGAVGWMALNPHFEEAYGAKGCFEAEASGNSVARKAAQRMSPQAGSAAAVVAAAAQGDVSAAEIMAETTRYLGMAVANLVSTLNPQMVVLGGGLFQARYDLISRVRGECARWAQPFAAARVRIELSALGSRAGLVGAARIALDSVLPVGTRTSQEE